MYRYRLGLLLVIVVAPIVLAFVESDDAIGVLGVRHPWSGQLWNLAGGGAFPEHLLASWVTPGDSTPLEQVPFFSVGEPAVKVQVHPA